MKKLALLTTMIICCTFATWAQPQGLSFTIYPEKSGEFRIFYSTYKAPSGKVLWVHWGEGAQTSHEGISSGSDPQKWIAGTVTYGKPIRIWCDYIDAILIYDRAEAIRCESNNPQLQYIYYFHDNLSPENLEALYMSLYNRNGKTGHGELHLSQTASIETASTNILKSNAFIPEGINWRVCSMKSFTGSSRTHWKLHKNECKKYLIPAITFQTKTTANMTDLQIGIKDTPEWPWIVDKSLIRIDDGTDNYNSLEVLRYPTNHEFEDNAPRLTIKGTGPLGGNVKIYGAMVSHFKTNQISTLNLDNITNLRFLSTRYSNYLQELLGINQQKHLNYLDLSGNKYLLKLNVNACPNLETLRVGGCWWLGELWFTKTKLQFLDFGQCAYLPRNKISTISDATKLNRVFAENLDWDACELDAFYRDLRPSPPPNALISVDNMDHSAPSNDWAGSNKTIATDKGWSVERYDQGWIYLSGNGGGCTTGISQEEAAKFISVFPNPATDVVNITLVPNLNAESLQVIDFTGKTVFTMPVSPSKSEYQINVSNYSKGVYLIRVGSITHKMLVK